MTEHKFKEKMKREILFRGWSTDFKKRVIGWLSSPNTIAIESGDDYDDFPVIPETVGQFTGLKDKNGVKTFSEDIVKYTDDSGTLQIGVVTWCEFKYSIIAIGGDDEGNQDIELHPDYEWVIIGNIHENPELLEEK